MRTRIKICGITNLKDLELAIELGADAIGFNMFPSSKRYIDVDTARLLVEAVPPFVSSVGLFVNETPEKVAEVCAELPFDCLQFSGDEDNQFCRQFGKPFIKSLRIGKPEDLHQQDEYPDAEACLLDAHIDGQYGGTGETIDWQNLGDLSASTILAGGLDADNVEQAIEALHPYALDLCTGVEASPGKKDAEKMREFFTAVKRSDQ